MFPGVLKTQNNAIHPDRNVGEIAVVKEDF